MGTSFTARVQAIVPRRSVLAVLLIFSLLAVTVFESVRPVWLQHLKKSASVTFTEYQLPAGQLPLNIIQGPDARYYFTVVGLSASIGAINNDGSGLVFYPIPNGCGPQDLAFGSNSTIWFTQPFCSQIGRMNIDGTNPTELQVPAPYGRPWDIVLGPDLNLWITLQNGGIGTGTDASFAAVARVSTLDATFTIYPLAPFSRPTGIAVGAGDSIWAAEPGIQSLATIDIATGSIHEFSIGADATEVAQGSDGNMWFAGDHQNLFGELSLSGTTETTYSLLTSGADSYTITDLVTGPDGNVWYTGNRTDSTGVVTAVLGNFDVHGAFQDFALPPASDTCCARSPGGIFADSIGQIWYTDANQHLVGHTGSVAPIAPAPSPPSQTSGGSPSATPPPTCQQTGSPVNCATGELWHRFLDLSIRGRGPSLWLVRTYSTARSSHDGPLGFGWTYSYNMSLTVAGDGSVTVHEEGGSAIGFRPSGSGAYTAPAWVFATLVRNADGTYTLQRKNQTSFRFNSSGNLIQEQDRNGKSTTLSYTSGQLTTVTDSSGRQLQFQYSGSRISKITDPIQRSVAFQYDGSGNLVSATDVAGGVTRFTYDAIHLMLNMTDPRGGVLSNTYDASGRVVRQTDAMNRTTNWVYGAGTTTITDPMGNMTQETFQNGELVSLTKGFGTVAAATWTITYDPLTFTVASTTDADGHTTSYVSDASGNLLSATDPLQRKLSFSYNSRNDLTSVTDPMGNVTQIAFSGNPNPTQISRVLNGTQVVTTIGYDPSNPGDAISLKDPDGNTFQFAYDQFGNVSKATDALGNAATFTYDAASRLLTMVTPRGGTTSYTYGPFNDVLRVTDPLGHTSNYQYDPNRNLTAVTDANGHTAKLAYDLDNEQLNSTLADGSQAQNVYNADGRLSSQIDALGHATTYAYDQLNRLASATDALNRVTTIGYDPAGNRTLLTDSKGQKTSFAYDAANQIIGITFSDGKTASVSYQYDANGRRTGMTDGTGSTSYAYDSLGRLTQSVNGAGAGVGYSYDLRGDLTSLVYPDVSQVSQTFDGDGRIASVTDSLGHRTNFVYDANGNLITETYPNGVTTQLTYDAADRLTKITDSGPQGQLIFVQGRDNLGQLTSETVSGEPPYGPVNYGYDQVNRLTSANYGFARLGYQYDAANRLTQTTASSFGQTAVSAMSYDNADQLVRLTTTHGSDVLQKLQFTYDANGNRVQRADQKGNVTNYGYDQANRLTSYGTVAQYTYNGDGIRMSKTVNGATQAFTWDLSAPLPILIQDGSTRYVSGPDGLPLEQIQADGTVRYYHQDALGSTRALTNAKGQVDTVYLYDPYGNALSISGSKVANPFQFAGQYTDAESGFQYLTTRYYDPSTANFLTRDPAFALTHSAYGYAHDSPLNYADPSGLDLSLSGAAQWFYDNSETIGNIFGLLSLIFSETVLLGLAFDVISSVAGVCQGFKHMSEGKPWWVIAWDFAGPLATTIKVLAGAVKIFATLAVKLKEGASLWKSAKQAVQAGVKDFNVKLIGDELGKLLDTSRVYKVSDAVGDVLTWLDLFYKSVTEPTADTFPIQPPAPAPALQGCPS